MNKDNFITRVLEVLRLCDQGDITDEQAINKIMRSSTKYMQTRFAETREQE